MPPEAPDAPALCRWLASDAGVRDHALSDGRYTIAYADTPELLERIDAWLVRYGVGTAHPVALECPQSAAGALVLLYLLSRQYDVVLLPDLTGRSKEAGTIRFIPSFCSHVVAAGTDDGRRSQLLAPESSLECTVNEAFVAEPELMSATGPSLYLRTSGSTGTPKLTRMTHQKWLNNALACVERWKLTADDRLMVPVPIFHSYGFGAAFLPGLLAGASMHIVSDANIVRYLEREAQFDPNIAFLTPGMCDTFLSRRRTPRAHRLVVTAGDRVKRDTMAGFEPRFGPLLNLYGSAEMGAVSSASPDDPLESRIGTAGYPLAGIELHTEITSENTSPGSTQGAGILQCRQRNGSDGYLALTDHWRFEPRSDASWFQMGDLAKVRADGYVEIHGRSTLSIKRDGLLVVFADVEAVLEQTGGVGRAIVFAHGDSARGAGLIAICLADGPSASLQPDELLRHCRERLPRYAVPDHIAIVDSLPTLPSGKIDREALRIRFSQSGDVALRTARPGAHE